MFMTHDANNLHADRPARPARTSAASFTLGLLGLLLSLSAVGCIIDNSDTVAPDDSLTLAPGALDGGRVVASGKPPLSFLYPGTGRLAIRNLTEKSLIFSLDMPSNFTGGATLVRIDAVKRNITSLAGGNEYVLVDKIDPNDRYIITYVGAEGLPGKR